MSNLLGTSEFLNLSKASRLFSETPFIELSPNLMFEPSIEKSKEDLAKSGESSSMSKCGSSWVIFLISA